ncbi:MAG: 7,8-didemethyl-8-hydroxy-5-deazariboflavin synthase subunit CofH [Thermoprotei archaeon]|nr:MAG: 7,8-didemethyl-8-hydroxy-5-deazariboflavin synthase subunit CofH [Thermoprotei archaeon]
MLKVTYRRNDIVSFIERVIKSIDSYFSDIIDKAIDGKDISEREAVRLFEAKNMEINILAFAADYLRWKTIGDIVTFVVNRNINFTNECMINCNFCAYSKPVGHPEAYTLSINEIVRKALKAWRHGATEVCIQGAINPKISPEFYLNILRSIKKVLPEIHIHAFSPQEVHYFATKMDVSYREALKMLKEAGLDSMPGTAAEILDDEVRKIICPRKINVKTWVEIIKTAHSLGIPTTSTMMYGHVDTSEHKAKHLNIIREIQKETHGFTEFVPLSFIHYKTRLYTSSIARPGATGLEDLKVHAVSRIFLNNYIKNIQVSWVKLGPKYAQVVLNAGANDFGGTLMEENISRAAGATSGTWLPVERIIKIIRDAGRIPAQRTTIYEIVKIY